MIPREGVESSDRRRRVRGRDQSRVIPREGVESLRLVNSAVGGKRVIPREGVERSYRITIEEERIISTSDPERGS